MSYRCQRVARSLHAGGAQKDLNKMCSLSTPSDACVDKMSSEIAWNWDKVDFTGANRSRSLSGFVVVQISFKIDNKNISHDACALFDINGNGFADFSLCASLAGNARVVQKSAMVLYSCRDARPDRCLDAAVVGCKKGVGNYDPTGTSCAAGLFCCLLFYLACVRVIVIISC